MRPRWTATPLLIALTLMVVTVPDAHAYNFWDLAYGESFSLETGIFRYRPTGYPEDRWDPVVWPSGGTGVVALHDDPYWYEGGAFEDYEDLSAFVQRWGLDPWTSVQTADIRLKLVRIAPGAALPENSIIEITPPGGIAQRTAAWRRERATTNRSIFYHTYNCSVVVTLPSAEEWLKGSFMHEMGHCLGLGHSGSYADSSSNPSLWEAHLSRLRWHVDPIMSYGRRRVDGVFQSGVLFDDQVGASLLRPRPGWLETTGELWGQVTLSSESGASLVKVLASRLGVDGRMAETVVVFTDTRGYFAMAGLPPGDYFLQVHVAADHDRRALDTYFDERAPFTEIRNTLFTAPYRVRAAASTGPVLLTVQEHIPENIRR